MNANEIVKKLREACTDNEYAPPMATNKMLIQAADLIESLQAELAEYKNTGLTSKDIQKIATAKSEGRLIIRPFTWEEIQKQIG